MEVLARLRAGGREIACGVATTGRGRAAALAQRFRVYQRSGYHRPGFRVDRDAYDRRAVSFFLAVLGDGELAGLLLGGARVVPDDSRPQFRFPTGRTSQFELPARFQQIPVNRLVTEPVQGVLIGGFLAPRSLVQAMTVYVKEHGLRLGLSIMKARPLRALHGAGLPFHELGPAPPTYLKGGPTAGYFYCHPDPATPVCWLADKLPPAVEHAASMNQRRYSVPRRGTEARIENEAATNPTRAGGRLRLDGDSWG
jgi:hypothetical protein